jgi:glycerol transport system ATP-binding protein
MNVLPCSVEGGRVGFMGQPVETAGTVQVSHGNGTLELGVRPEFIRFEPTGIPVEIVKAADVGRFRIVETRHRDHRIKLLVPEGQPMPSGQAHVRFDPKHTHVYRDGWLVN